MKGFIRVRQQTAYPCGVPSGTSLARRAESIPFQNNLDCLMIGMNSDLRRNTP